MKKLLHNQKSRAELVKLLEEETFNRQVASFYRYVAINDPKAFRDMLYATWESLGVLGRIYVSNEGINAQFSVPQPQWNAFVASLQSFEVLKDMFINLSEASDNKAFLKLKIQVRQKIVADGLDENIFETSTVGTHLSPIEFHHKLSEPNTIVVDTRNDYECEIGHFENALLPQERLFKDVLPELKERLDEHRDKNILLYCTGGIRCEKTSAYLKRQGYPKVFQLKGGIINYLKEVTQQDLTPKYKGSMFVFDGRMAEPNVGEDVLGRCVSCQKAYHAHVDCGNVGCIGLLVQCPECAAKGKVYCSPECEKVGQTQAQVYSEVPRRI